ncbi:hybrid sensor histidine kinase/response regulator [Polynucleobacter arcticus]|uniref:Chemotaxis protein CheA n=1 Tax=Polynucleobacter arcticus TaxID=1743165 RepID=A0A6M9PIC5_9BURK|nr:response regulator [Polynucleobacter arcticus]QKM60179.1 hybrid sensor histidine kinase/response regulator [Polynucleobacter arcticus]
MATIEDAELSALFKIESAEHLQKLDAGLLQLEKTPNDQALIQEIFREAHSLKGSARMLGLIEIQGLANTVEDMLGAVRAGNLAVTAEIVKPQLATLDRIRTMVAEAVGDVIPQGLNQIESTQQTPSELVSTTVAAQIEGRHQAASIPAAFQARPQPKTDSVINGRSNSLDFRIDTLRVDAKKLDFLLSQAAELVVSRSRILRWQAEFSDMINKLQNKEIESEQWAKEMQLMHSKLAEDAGRLNVITEEIESEIQSLRLLPISTLLEQFPRMVHDLAAEVNKQVDLVFEGEGTVADKRIIEEMKSPLMHMLRNAVDHGIELPEVRINNGKPPVGKILIKVSQDADHVRLDVIDDGKGLDLEAIRQQAVKRHIFTDEQAIGLDETQLKNVLMTPGFSTNKMITDISGRGVGLDVVRSSVERMHGTLAIESVTGKGMTFTLNLPVSLTSTRVMILREWGENYALPCEAIYFSKILKPEELLVREDRQCFYHNDEIITVNRLGTLLERSLQPVDPGLATVCVVIRVADFSFGLIIDELHNEEDIVLKAPPPPIKRLRNISGVTILDSGLVCAVLNASDLAKTVRQTHQKMTSDQSVLESPIASSVKAKSLLLVEDSIVTRIQEKRILEAAGYEVVTAVDGLNAWNLLNSRSFDAIVSDIMMPNMDGLELAAKIRSNRKFADIPIILVTSLASEDDRRRGLDVGADAYISKSDFDQTVLLDSIARLI